jgi:DNA-binding response OmpR family regulator
MTVLVVDDDPVSRRLLVMTLERRKHAVAAVATADEAIEWLKSEAGATLVITDLDLPGRMSGLKFFSFLRANARWRNMPVIVCTGLTDEATVQDAIGRGVRHYLVKPIKPAVLLAKVEEILARTVPVLEPRFDAMARLEVSEIEYKYLVEDSSEYLASLKERMDEARKTDALVDAMGHARHAREPAALLGAGRLVSAVDALEEASNTQQRDQAFGLISQEIDILCEALVPLKRPGQEKRAS